MVRKNKLIKDITIDELAVMMNNSFEAQTKLITDGLDKIGGDIKEVKSLIVEFGGRTKKLEEEVGYIKNSLSIPELK